MNRPGRHLGLLPTLLCAALLVSAQLSSALHAFKHDAGTAQSKVCASCVGASQLKAGCAAIPQVLELDLHRAAIETAKIPCLVSAEQCVARQRGPPTNV
jgi:hypothetical protein